MKTKCIAFYFPQFHSFPENDKWWGKGFNDWSLVKSSKPLYKEHYQPRVPLNNNYYNPCEAKVLEEQAILAKKYGIYGFMFYHYFFDGKLLLEKPLETFLKNKNINISFCLAWANETWTRSWVGSPQIILQEQKHTVDRSIWEKHFMYLLPYFLDKRYIRINDKPVFLIYQPAIILHSEELFSFWDDLARKNGLKGLYLIAIKNHQFNNPDFLRHYDGLLKFQPREAFNSSDFKKENLHARFNFLRNLPEKWQGYLRRLAYVFNSYTIIDSNKVWNTILKHAYEKQTNLAIYESAFFEWDNTPRYGKHAKIYTGLSKEKMKENLFRLAELAEKNDSEFIFFNAWNEWSESAYLEPDEKNGLDYLNIIKSVFDKYSEEGGCQY